MNNFFVGITSILLIFSPILANGAMPQSNGRIEQVQFSQGATSKVIKGQIKGDNDIDYVVKAGAGQTLKVTLQGTNLQNYFNVNPPNSEQSMFVGSSSGNTFQGILPTEGNYTIRVYLMRPAARRNESSNYTLNISITGKSLASVSSKVDAVIPGTNFHASAKVVCRGFIDDSIKQCEAFVIRRGFDGTATVEIRSSNLKRRILFVKGNPIASDSPYKLSVVRKGDLNIISLGDLEKFEIPDVLVTGG
jgi:hypothetical protein